jgi:ribokinase
MDVLGKVPRHPEEDTKTELLDLEMQCGGPASTAMVTLVRLGARAAFLGSVGDDAFGRRIQDRLGAEGVDASGLRSTPDRTSQFAFIAVSRGTGRRTIFWHRGTAPPLEPGEVDLSRYPGARILHLDGLMMEASMEAARQAHRRDMLVVLDAGTFREGSLELTRQVDILIASERFAEPLTGEDASPEEAVRALQDHCAGRVVITLGEQGSLGHDGRCFVRQPPFPVEVEDTTGAGDVYHGAYIYGLLQGWDMVACMRYAGAAAAMKCTRLGAQRGIPDRASLEAFLGGPAAPPA